MLYYQFNGYEEFKRLLGKKGERSILRAFYKSEGLFMAGASKLRASTIAVPGRRLFKRGGELPYKFPRIESLSEMERFIEDHVSRDIYVQGANPFILCGVVLHSSKYRLDDYNGICEDGDTESVRYVLAETGRTYKMKATKFFSRVLRESAFIQSLNPVVVNYYASDVLAKKWEAYATEEIGKREACDYELHVDDNFEAIYSSYRCRGDFGSCMEDEGRDSFYAYFVSAKAAYLTNDDGGILARAVIFTDVSDVYTGEKLRLCERQYSSGGDETLKRVLVNKLIAAGKIDGYKRIGADCHSSKAFVSNGGEDWSNRVFSIRCYLNYGDTLSYQDSFKFYDLRSNIAYNDCSQAHDHELDTTDPQMDGGEYDSWNERYCAETETVYYQDYEYTCDVDSLDHFVYCDGPHGERYYHESDVRHDDYHGEDTAYDLEEVSVHGRTMYCSVNELDDFENINGRYYHMDDVCECGWCGACYVTDSDLTSDLPELKGRVFCCDECLKKAEKTVLEERDKPIREQRHIHKGQIYCEIGDCWEYPADVVFAFREQPDGVFRGSYASAAELLDLQSLGGVLDIGDIDKIIANEPASLMLGRMIITSEHNVYSVSRVESKSCGWRLKYVYIGTDVQDCKRYILEHGQEVA